MIYCTFVQSKYLKKCVILGVTWKLNKQLWFAITLHSTFSIFNGSTIWNYAWYDCNNKLLATELPETLLQTLLCWKRFKRATQMHYPDGCARENNKFVFHLAIPSKFQSKQTRTTFNARMEFSNSWLYTRYTNHIKICSLRLWAVYQLT